MRHSQQARWSYVSLRVVRPNHHRVFDIVVDGVKFASFRINRDTRNETDVRLWTDDLPTHVACFTRVTRAQVSIVTHHALPISISHYHDVINRIDRHADESRMGIDDGTRRRDITSEGFHRSVARFPVES